LALSTKAATANGFEMGTGEFPLGDTCSGIKVMNTKVLSIVFFVK
jgi:hypothetical protein